MLQRLRSSTVARVAESTGNSSMLGVSCCAPGSTAGRSTSLGRPSCCTLYDRSRVLYHHYRTDSAAPLVRARWGADLYRTGGQRRRVSLETNFHRSHSPADSPAGGRTATAAPAETHPTKRCGFRHHGVVYQLVSLICLFVLPLVCWKSESLLSRRLRTTFEARAYPQKDIVRMTWTVLYQNVHSAVPRLANRDGSQQLTREPEAQAKHSTSTATLLCTCYRFQLLSGYEYYFCIRIFSCAYRKPPEGDL